MSISNYLEDEKKCFKPDLKYKIGDQVFLKIDKKGTYPMLITMYDLTDDNCNDYYVTWFNSQGKIEDECFPEECLVKEINNQ